MSSQDCVHLRYAPVDASWASLRNVFGIKGRPIPVAQQTSWQQRAYHPAIPKGFCTRAQGFPILGTQCAYLPAIPKGFRSKAQGFPILGTQCAYLPAIPKGFRSKAQGFPIWEEHNGQIRPNPKGIS